MRDDQFERLYEENAQALYAFLVYRVGDRALAEDLVAEAFERAYRARGRFDRRRASERTWLFSIALNRMRDHMRRAAVEERGIMRATPGGSGPEEDRELSRVEDRDELVRALAGLSEEEREAIALRYGGDLTGREVANVLGVRVTTAEGRLSRGLRKLKAELE